MQHNGPQWLYVTNVSFFPLIFRRTVTGRKETRSLIKNSSHWRYETQFIHTSFAQQSKRLTTDWFVTSVNLPKWASCQIFATAPALINLQYCTSVWIHFCLFLFSLSTLKSLNHYFCITRQYCCVSLPMEPFSLKSCFLWNMWKDKQKQWQKGTFISPFKLLLAWWHKSDTLNCDSSSCMSICSSIKTSMSLKAYQSSVSAEYFIVHHKQTLFHHWEILVMTTAQLRNSLLTKWFL